MRDNALDLLRGLLIFYIVTVIHGIFWLDILPEHIGSIILFEMSAIFVIAGYAYYLFEQTNPAFNERNLNLRSYVYFLQTRSFRILLPYLVYVFFCIVVITIYSAINGDETLPLLQLAIQWINPFTYGSLVHSLLDSHLWFVPVFLLVSLAMPIVTKFRSSKKAHLMIIITAITFLLFLDSKFSFIGEKNINQSLFYLCFSLLGYHLGRNKAYFEKVNFIKVGTFCALLLLVFALMIGNIYLLNMQMNKFPPNHIFFLFSCIWMSFFLHITFRHSKIYTNIAWLQHSKLLKPFIQYGYSIFLWQGVGYTFSLKIGQQLDLPILITWLLAIAITVLLGCLFGPIEKMRIRLKTH